METQSTRFPRAGRASWLSLALFALAAPVVAQGAERDAASGPFAAAIERAAPAVVHVAVEVSAANTYRLQRPGSGVVVGAGGLVLTWRGLVEPSREKGAKLLLQREGEAAVPARIVATDEATDLALVQPVGDAGRGWASVPIRSNRAAAGHAVAVLSLHDGEERVAFAGVVSPALGPVRMQPNVETRTLAAADVLLTDAPIQGRNHGGALLSTDGLLVGLCNAENVVDEVAEPTVEQLLEPNFGFVVPADVALRVFAPEFRSAGVASGAKGEPALAGIQAAIRGTVSIFQGKGTPPAAPPTRDPYARLRVPGLGSGVVLDADGLIVTNAHLVQADRPILVRTADGRQLRARRVAVHEATNLALLATTEPPSPKLEAMPVAESGGISSGDPVFAVGVPFGGAPVVTAGVLSAARGPMVQVDARLGNENAGGALVDREGQLLGIVDGGRVDKVVAAFRRRGDQARVESGLNRSPAMRTVLAVFRDELNQRSGDAAPWRRPVQAAGGSTEATTVEAISGAMLNIYIEEVVAGAAVDDNPFATAQQQTRVTSLGSGVVIDPRGLALTNWHVVDAATESDGSPRKDHVVRARTFDGTSHAVEVLSISREEDLALIRLLDVEVPVASVDIASSAELTVGDRAIALGNPEGNASTVTVGVVTAKDQSIRVRGRWAKLPELVETDAAINGGNSGGALVDAAGRLIGINSAGGSAFSVTGYAISSDRVADRLRELLLSAHKMRSPYVGFRVAVEEGGLTVRGVDPTGPAARAGLESGTRITALGGVKIGSEIDFALARQTLEAGPFVVDLETAAGTRSLEIDAMDRDLWWVQRQLGMEMERVTIRDDAALVQQAATGLIRSFTGDATASPRMLPGAILRVARVVEPVRTLVADDEEPASILAAAAETKRLVPLRKDDVLLAFRLAGESGGGATEQLIRFETVASLRDALQQHAAYGGRGFDAYVWRDGEVQLLRIGARKLLW